jgi:hypothetical protein
MFWVLRIWAGVLIFVMVIGQVEVQVLSDELSGNKRLLSDIGECENG